MRILGNHVKFYMEFHARENFTLDSSHYRLNFDLRTVA